MLLAACCTPSHASELVVTPEMFGAIGDGKANDWLPIQRALSACRSAVYNVTAPRPCRVLFAQEYLSGPLILNSSRTTLEVAAGARLVAFAKPDYEKACPQTGCPFISTAPGAEGCRTVYPNPHAPADGYEVCLHDLTLTGGGTIDGGATWDPSSWWLCARLAPLPFSNCWRPMLTYFVNVTGLIVNGTLTLKDAPTGFMRLYGNVGTRVSGLRLSAPWRQAHVHGAGPDRRHRPAHRARAEGGLREELRGDGSGDGDDGIVERACEHALLLEQGVDRHRAAQQVELRGGIEERRRRHVRQQLEPRPEGAIDAEAPLVEEGNHDRAVVPEVLVALQRSHHGGVHESRPDLRSLRMLGAEQERARHADHLLAGPDGDGGAQAKPAQRRLERCGEHLDAAGTQPRRVLHGDGRHPACRGRHAASLTNKKVGRYSKLR